MHQIPFLLLILCVHMARTENSPDCDGRPCRFGKCIGKKCECDPGFTPRAPWNIQTKYYVNPEWTGLFDFACGLSMDTKIPGVCTRNPRCAIGASCKNDMCTCDEIGWSVGPIGTMFENMCTVGTMKDCQVTTTATSSSKCLRPIFVTCENMTNSHSCNCEMPDEHAKPEYFGSYDSQCQLKIDALSISIPLSTNDFRFFFNIPGDKPCADELLPEYTCGCKEGTESCNSIVGAQCSGAPDPDCYVPRAIFCNKTIGKCDCDLNQGYIWRWWSGRCHGIPGANCSKTEDCAHGSNCEGEKCSSCPGTQTLDWSNAICAAGIMEPCKVEEGECPAGTWYILSNDKGRHLCHCEGNHVEFHPRLNECVSLLVENCNRVEHKYWRKCKPGTGTVCKDDRQRERHICVCDEKMGLSSYGKFSGWECLVTHDHPCKPNGTKCLQEEVFKSKTSWQCLQSKDNADQYTCVAVPIAQSPTPEGKYLAPEEKDYLDDGEENIIGSNAVIGFGLASAAIYALNY